MGERGILFLLKHTYFTMLLVSSVQKSDSVLYIYVCVCVCTHAQAQLLCLTLCDSMDYSCQVPCPWDFPGKNTGVGCHFFVCVCVCMYMCIYISVPFQILFHYRLLQDTE